VRALSPIRYHIIYREIEIRIRSLRFALEARLRTVLAVGDMAHPVLISSPVVAAAGGSFCWKHELRRGVTPEDLNEDQRQIAPPRRSSRARDSA